MSVMKKPVVAFVVLFSAILALSGCDLGTYNERLNDRSVPKAESPAENDDTSEKEATDDGTEDEN